MEYRWDVKAALVCLMMSVGLPAVAQRLGCRQTELKEWQFSKDRVTWETVSVPHSCNAVDGHSFKYYRDKTYYKRTLVLDKRAALQPHFLLLEGAAQTAEVTVNGRMLKHHDGGYTAFAVPLKGQLRAGENVIEVMCNNKMDPDVIPVSADFNMNNGLHNPAFLLRMNDVYFSPLTHGLYRMHVSTPVVTRDMATAKVTTTVCNDGTKLKQFYVVTRLSDASGRTVAETGRTSALAAGQECVVEENLTLRSPHLWDGLDDPYLYTATMTLYDKQGGKELDRAETKVGFRHYEMRRNEGFYLNGRHYPLRGVCMHQDMDGRASAVLKEDFDRDYGMVKELGCNFLRLAHYPHNDYVYRLCDSLGVVVQTEIPWVNICGVKATPRYFEVIRQQMTEMISNLYNHPAIFFWGMWNEVDAWGNSDAFQGKIDLPRVVEETNRLYDLARGLDPYRRIGLTDDSQFYREGYAQLHTDYHSENLYNGWYHNVGKTEEFGRQMRSIHDRMGVTNVAEYGAGINPFCHSSSTDQAYLRKDNAKHFEEYGNFMHESHWQQIVDMPFLNFTSLWLFFDFPVAARREGYIDSDDGVNFKEVEARKYINDKGLVTRDRKTKKDVFYLYKSAWNHNETTVYITSRRLRFRPADEPITVKVYSNAANLTLYQNGQKVETLTSSGENSGVIWTFSPVKFQSDEDTFKVVAADGTTDEVKWKRRL